jgi:glycerate 2-kinase
VGDKNYFMKRFGSETIDSAIWGDRVRRVLGAAIQSVEPGRAVREHLSCYDDHLFVGKRDNPVCTFDLNQVKRILVVGAGKAGAPMARSVADILDRNLTEGVVIVKEGYGDPGGDGKSSRMHILEAGHPVPDLRGVEGAKRIASLLANPSKENLVICLVSGGGSALLVLPAPGVSLSDLKKLTSLLLSSGADINQINTLRKHLEQMKGGGLARMAYPARLVSLILSDVIGNPLDVIASGPTVPDPSTFRDAFHILQRYSLLEKTPSSILSHLKRGLRGEIPETLKEGDPALQNVQNVVVGDNLTAAQAAVQQAAEEGFNTMLLTTDLQGEARDAGRFLASIVGQVAGANQPIPRPACIVAGGETTVTVTGNGLGGRNQELALGAVADLAGLPDIALVTLATDGGDGPTDAAGAIVTGETLRRAHRLGLDPVDYLNRNDAYHFFEPLRDLLKPGPTRTNVNDLSFIFAF